MPINSGTSQFSPFIRLFASPPEGRRVAIPSSSMESSDRRPSTVFLFSVLALLTAGLVVYSQTMAFAWDEGFHILTAQLIKHGKRPYIDFVFSQTPLNAYLSAVWMAVFGESWRVPHAFSALCSAGAAILT